MVADAFFGRVGVQSFASMVCLEQQGGALQSAYVDGHKEFERIEWDSRLNCLYEGLRTFGCVFGLVCCLVRPSFTQGSIIFDVSVRSG